MVNGSLTPGGLWANQNVDGLVWLKALIVWLESLRSLPQLLSLLFLGGKTTPAICGEEADLIHYCAMFLWLYMEALICTTGILEKKMFVCKAVPSGNP